VAALARDEHDLLVVGGGIYGVAAAGEAAQAGLKVALVEAEDFGAGASWNSLKTIHGGLRHLQRLDLASHRESVRERRRLLALAPRLVRPLRFLVPVYGHGLKGREALGFGLFLDNLLALDRNEGLPVEQRLEDGRLLGRAEALAWVPGLAPEGLTGAAVWQDAQVESSERLTVALLRAAVSRGAVAANHCPAQALLVKAGRVGGARVCDAETGLEHEVRARMTLNAAGPALLEGLPSERASPMPLGPWLQAMNLVLAGPWPLSGRLAVGGWSGGRSLFLMPWRDHLLAGTDYWPASEPRPGAVDSFRNELARAFPWAGLADRQVTLVHRGRVPGGPKAADLHTRPLVLDHEAHGGPAGLVTVQGVKYTTARAVARRAVAVAASRLGRVLPGCAPDGPPLSWAAPLEGDLGERVRVAVRDEMACSLGDAVLRRLDLGTAGPPPESVVDEVLALMARERAWDEPRKAAEKEALARFYQDAYNGEGVR